MVRGTTFAERQAARKERTRTNRLTHFVNKIRDAQTGRQRLQQACQFAKAVGDDLGDAGRNALARAIAEAAEAAEKEHAA